MRPRADPPILELVNQRLAYVAVSRGQHDARIYTDDKVRLTRALGRDVSHRSALEFIRTREGTVGWVRYVGRIARKD